MAIDVYKDWLGIPEDQRPPDHYQLLRLVQFEDDPDKIQANYRKLNAHVRKYASGQYMDESQALLNELAKAMLCLTDVQRKRDYDQQFGREFDEEETLGELTVDKVLIEQGHINESQAKEAQGMCDSLGIEIRDALVQLKAVKADVAARALATSLGIPFLDLTEIIPDDSVLDRVPRSMVKKNSILPLFVDEDDDVLLVACVNPMTADVEDDLRLRFELPSRQVLSTPLAINQALAKYYAPGAREEAAEEIASPKKKASKPGAKPKAAKKSTSREDDARQGKMVSLIVVCWSFVGAYLLDSYLLSPGVYFDILSILLGWLLIPAIAIGFAWMALWPRP